MELSNPQAEPTPVADRLILEYKGSDLQPRWAAGPATAAERQEKEAVHHAVCTSAAIDTVLLVQAGPSNFTSRQVAKRWNPYLFQMTSHKNCGTISWNETCLESIWTSCRPFCGHTGMLVGGKNVEVNNYSVCVIMDGKSEHMLWKWWVTVAAFGQSVCRLKRSFHSFSLRGICWNVEFICTCEFSALIWDLQSGTNVFG